MTAADPARRDDEHGGIVRLLIDIKRRYDRAFSYRELLLRSGDRVRYIRLAPQFQKTASLLLAIGLTWGGYATIGYLDQRDLLDAREMEIARSQAAYGDLLAEVDRYQRQFATITRDLESTQTRLLAQLETEGRAEPPTLLAERAEEAADLRARMVIARDELREELQALELDLKDVARRNGSLKDSVQDLQAALTATEHDRAEVREAHQRLGRKLGETEASLAHERSDKAALAAEVLELEAEVGDWKSRYAALDEARTALTDERDLLAGSLVSERAATAALSQQVRKLQTALASAEAGVRDTVAARDELAATVAELRGELQQAQSEQTTLEERLAGEGDKVAQARDEIEELERHRAVLEVGTSRLAQALRQKESRNDALRRRAVEAERALADADAQVESLQDERDAGLRQVAKLAADLEGSREKVAGLRGQVYSLTRTLDQAEAKTQAVAEQRDLLGLHLAEARSQLSDQARQHDAVIQHLSERTRQSIDTMEELLALTGPEIEAVLDEATNKVEGDGKGGPFVPYEDVPIVPQAERPKVALDALDDSIRHWEALQLVLSATPLFAPIAEGFRLSSQYGKRTDPLNGRLSRHQGTDLVAPYRTPVLATAPGVVAFAGWKTGYGRVVEVDHGFGIRTLFAHLRRIDVEAGQKVGFRQQLGQLGNSGRSTGAHLHYEVRYNGQPLDPLKFMKAGNHVLKG